MSRQKSWIPRIIHILNYLEADTAESYRRGEIEKLFSISASQAKELMLVAGAGSSRPGVELTVPRPKLLDYLRYSPDGKAALEEIERRKKLATKLKKAESELKWRAIPLRVTKQDEWSRFSDLPNVSIQPGLMQVTFKDPVDLMDSLFRFIKAAGNEWDLYLKMCEEDRRLFIEQKLGDLAMQRANGA